MTNSPHSPTRDTGIHPLLPQAIAFHQSGRLADAAKLYEAILRESPQHFDAAHLLGVIAMQEGRLTDAQRAIGEALSIRPDDQAALINLTAAYLRDGRLELAAETGERAAKLLPVSVDALINYGTALHQLGRFRDAIHPLEIAQRLNPRSTEVCNLLGSCLLRIGDAPRAAILFEIATSVSPTDSNSWASLSAALNAMSEPDRALQCAKRALALGRDSSNALAAEAAAQFELGKIEESIATYEKAVAVNPTVIMLSGLARALFASGRPADAVPHLQYALELEDSNPYVRMLLAVSMLKPVHESIDEIKSSRAAFKQALEDLQAWYDANNVPDAYLAVGAMQPFFLAYHPFNNRDLLSRFGTISASWMKSLPNAEAHSKPEVRRGKFKVGIVSAHVRDQSVWNAILKGWVHQLDKATFDIHLFKLDTGKDQETLAAAAQVACFDDRPKSITDWVEAIRKSNLDVLIFDEIGMSAATLQIAALRLAPLQGTTWGHPETSGLPTLDFYLSGAAMEPPGAQNNYRERLIQLPNLGVYVEPMSSAVIAPDLRSLGLPPDEPLLLCAGSPYKYSPLHDWVWIEVARGLKARGRGRLVFFSDRKGSMHVLLSKRLRHSFTEAGLDFDSHVCIIPFLDRPRYIGLMQASALMLDTLDFSGFNTALQAIGCGLPYLAFEGEFMRGRLASCLLRRMNLPDLVANSYEDFVSRAVTLIAEQDGLKNLGVEITKRRQVLFHDTAAIRALEQFLAYEIGKLRSTQSAATSIG